MPSSKTTRNSLPNNLKKDPLVISEDEPIFTEEDFLRLQEEFDRFKAKSIRTEQELKQELEAVKILLETEQSQNEALKVQLTELQVFQKP